MLLLLLLLLLSLPDVAAIANTCRQHCNNQQQQLRATVVVVVVVVVVAVVVVVRCCCCQHCFVDLYVVVDPCSSLLLPHVNSRLMLATMDSKVVTDATHSMNNSNSNNNIELHRVLCQCNMLLLGQFAVT